jgi:uncharacterized membrane protein (UPF0127 family)
VKVGPSLRQGPCIVYYRLEALTKALRERGAEGGRTALPWGAGPSPLSPHGARLLAAPGSACYNPLEMIRNATSEQVLASKVKWCTTPLTRGLGLMFHPPLGKDKAYVFVERGESRTLTTIHMLFVFFPIAVIWLDAHKRVVDKVLARPFHPYYAPRQPAQYYLECHPDALSRVGIGDQLEF